MEIRASRLSDVPALLALEKASFTTDRLSARQMGFHIFNPRAEMLVATDKKGALLGYILILFRKGAAARVYSVAVAKAARGRGLGEKLMRRACGAARKRGAPKVTLQVRVRNKPAISLYEKLGFKIVKRLPKYYEDGEDGFMMALQLQRSR